MSRSMCIDQIFENPVPKPMAKNDLGYCRKTLNNGSKSFLAASHLLPSQMRNAATALYAFCREADDLIDLSDDTEKALKTVRERVAKIYRGEDPEHAADRALSSVVQHYSLPKALLDSLIEGFAWDTAGRHYQTLADVEDYGARVAGTVGAMMSLLMGARDESIVARACDLGVAMQLTNISRDVGEDARAGRCYLPIDWLDEVGVKPEEILLPESEEGVAIVVRRLLKRADELYQNADTGIASLPLDCQRGIRMARQLYAAIGTEIATLNYKALHQRAYVPKRRKLKLLAKNWARKSPCQNELLCRPPLKANTHLVDAVNASVTPEEIQIYDGLLAKPASTRDEVISVIQLIDKLEHAKRNELNASNGKVPFGFAGVVRH